MKFCAFGAGAGGPDRLTDGPNRCKIKDSRAPLPGVSRPEIQTKKEGIQ